MDIITHAVVGAATGAVFGHPIVGAITASFPDLVLGVKRRDAPNWQYDTTHSPMFAVVICVSAYSAHYALTGGASINVLLAQLFAWISHIALDIPTHGKDWAPRLFAPFSLRRCDIGRDWEWFNESWRVGFLCAVTWSVLCLFALAW